MSKPNNEVREEEAKMAQQNFVVMHKDVDPTTVGELKISRRIYAADAEADFEKYTKEGYNCIHMETGRCNYESHFVKFKAKTE